MTNPQQEAEFKAAQKETSKLLQKLPMAERMSLMSDKNNHPEFKVFSNKDKSLTGVLHVSLVPEGFEPDQHDKSRGR